MKRVSIVGPLVVIGIGVLLLLRNLNADLVNFHNLIRLWPFILIVWGVLRVGELVFWASRGRPLPTSGISGGEWFLIVLVTGGAWTTVQVREQLAKHGPPSMVSIGGIDLFGNRFDFPIEEQKLAATATPSIVIEDGRGTFRVNGNDGTDIRVSGQVSVRALDGGDAERSRRESRLSIVKEGDRYFVRNNLSDSVRNGSRSEFNVDVFVPRGASVQYRGRSGELIVNDVAGTVTVDTERTDLNIQNVGKLIAKVKRGDVRVTDVKQQVEVEGSGGSVEIADAQGSVSVNGEFDREMSFRNLTRGLYFKSKRTDFRVDKVEGRVRLNNGDLDAVGLAGPITLTSRSKDVTLSDYTGPLEIKLDRGSVEARPGHAPVGRTKIELSNGDVTYAIPEKAAFVLSAKAEHGSVENSYGSELRETCVKNDCELAGMLGPNGTSIDVRTRRGTVTVSKGVFSEIPESAPVKAPASPAPPKAPTPPRAPAPVAPKVATFSFSIK